MQLQPWRVESSTSVLKDRWIDVRADNCVTAEGRQIAPYYVLSYPDWVHVVAVDVDGNLVLVEQYRHGIAAMSLELPGGGIDRHEEPLDAGRRELAEETGYTATQWLSCGKLSPNPANQSNYSHILLAKDVRQLRQPQDDPTERIRIHRVSIPQAIDYALTGRICQALHVSALLTALAAGGYCQIAAR